MEPLLRGQTASRGWRGHPSCPAKSRAKPAPSPLSYPYRTHTQTSTNGTRPSTSVARDHPVTVRVTLRPTYGAAPLDPALRDAVARARDHSRNSRRRAPTAGCTSTKPCANLVSDPSGPQLSDFGPLPEVDRTMVRCAISLRRPCCTRTVRFSEAYKLAADRI